MRLWLLGRHADAVGAADVLRLPAPGRRRLPRVRSRVRRAPSIAGARLRGHSGVPRVLQPPSLRPHRRLSAPPADALGPGCRPGARARGVRPARHGGASPSASSPTTACSGSTSSRARRIRRASTSTARAAERVTAPGRSRWSTSLRPARSCRAQAGPCAPSRSITSRRTSSPMATGSTRRPFVRLFGRHGSLPRAADAGAGLRRAGPHVPLPERYGAVQDLRRVHHGALELAELAQAARVRNLVLSHVTAQFDRPGMRERVIREVGEIFEGNVFFGEDLMEIPFTSAGRGEARLMRGSGLLAHGHREDVDGLRLAANVYGAERLDGDIPRRGPRASRRRSGSRAARPWCAPRAAPRG